MITLTVIIAVALLLFVWGKWSPDIVALLAMLSLYFFGILNVEEVFSGFSNPTVLMIASLFIVGEGLARTGWTAFLGEKFVQWAKSSESKLTALVISGSGLLSGFVSNTGTVAAMMPTSISAALNLKLRPSKILMPLAFGANTGGLLTLTGTPPNVIASNALEKETGTGFNFFEFAWIGFPLLLAINLYFLWLGRKLLPNKKSEKTEQNLDNELQDWLKAYKVQGNYFHFRIRTGSPLTNTKIGDWAAHPTFPETVVQLRRRHPNLLKKIPPMVEMPDSETEMRYHDIITVAIPEKDVNQLISEFRLGLLPNEKAEDQIKKDFVSQEVGLAQVVVSATSRLIHKKINFREFLKNRKLQLIGYSRDGQAINDQDVYVEAGDSMLIRGTWLALSDLTKEYDRLVVVGNPDAMSKDVKKLVPKSYVSLALLVAMVLGLIFLPISSAIITLSTAGLMVLTKCLPVEQIYKGISWTSVVMIAAMIPLGLAMEKTGLMKLAAETFLSVLGSDYPLLLLITIFTITSFFSQIINNSATAVLMAPLAILIATSTHYAPEPFLMAIAVSASTAFLTPVGTTTNAMVLTSGSYAFKDYVRVGAPLLVLYLLISCLIIPLIWRF